MSFRPSQDSAGPDGAPGYHHVARLAQSLVEHCTKGYITQAEVEEIVGLWESLDEADKGPVVYPPRKWEELVKGRFKKAKVYAPISAHVPGIESMRQYVCRNPSSSPYSCRSTSCQLISLPCLVTAPL